VFDDVIIEQLHNLLTADGVPSERGWGRVVEQTDLTGSLTIVEVKGLVGGDSVFGLVLSTDTGYRLLDANWGDNSYVV
jgi:hypothetical protein